MSGVVGVFGFVMDRCLDGEDWKFIVKSVEDKLSIYSRVRIVDCSEGRKRWNFLKFSVILSLKMDEARFETTLVYGISDNKDISKEKSEDFIQKLNQLPLLSSPQNVRIINSSLIQKMSTTIHFFTVDYCEPILKMA
jgi:hypothetical protein